MLWSVIDRIETGTPSGSISVTCSIETRGGTAPGRELLGRVHRSKGKHFRAVALHVVIACPAEQDLRIEMWLAGRGSNLSRRLNLFSRFGLVLDAMNFLQISRF